MAQRGGRRAGAGRPAGSGWKPRVAALRAGTVQKMQAIVTAEVDPLTVVAGWILDENLDREFRLQAASVALPFLYPRLSASSVDARVQTTTIDATKLVERLNERLERLAPAEPPAVTIEAASVEPVEADPE